MPRPRVLVLGGLDPSGGAGITLDTRVLELHGCHGLPVATCLTVQNSKGFVAAHPAPSAWFAAMLRAALDDGEVHAAKLGMFADAATLSVAAAGLTGLRVPVVVDPVLSATAGGYAAADPLVQAYRAALSLLQPVLTPNHDELARLARAGDATELLALGCSGVVVKGGHGGGADVVERVHMRSGTAAIRHARSDCGRVHGTGCAFAAALAARLAHGQPLVEATTAAGAWVGGCLAAMGRSADEGVRHFVPQACGVV